MFCRWPSISWGFSLRCTTKHLKNFPHPVAEILQTYAWPGNVRELANVMEHAHVLASGETIELSDIPLRLQTGSPKQMATDGKP